MMKEFDHYWFKHDQDNTIDKSQENILKHIKEHIEQIIDKLGSDSDAQAFYKSILGLVEGMQDKSGYGSNISGKYRVMPTTSFHFILYSKKLINIFTFTGDFVLRKLGRLGVQIFTKCY